MWQDQLPLNCAPILSGYTKLMIGIVDYNIGNLRSVQKAFQHVGGEAVFVRTPEEIARVDALVLPGVGAFADCRRGIDALPLLGTGKIDYKVLRAQIS